MDSQTHLMDLQTKLGLKFNLLSKAGAVVRSDKAAQDFPHLRLENLQGWRSYYFSRPLLKHPAVPTGMIFPCYQTDHSPLCPHYALPLKAWLHLLRNLRIGVGGLALGLPKVFLSQ